MTRASLPDPEIKQADRYFDEQVEPKVCYKGPISFSLADRVRGENGRHVPLLDNEHQRHRVTAFRIDKNYQIPAEAGEV